MTIPAAADPVDIRWGPLPGARPPIPVWLLSVFAAALAVLLSVVVLAVVRPAGPLDQYDLDYQRDGLLLSAQVGPVTFGGRPVVLLFLREAPDPPCAWAGGSSGCRPAPRSALASWMVPRARTNPRAACGPVGCRVPSGDRDRRLRGHSPRRGPDRRTCHGRAPAR